MDINRNDGNHFLNASFAGEAFRVCSVEDKSSSRMRLLFIYFPFYGDSDLMFV